MDALWKERWGERDCTCVIPPHEAPHSLPVCFPSFAVPVQLGGRASFFVPDDWVVQVHLAHSAASHFLTPSSSNTQGRKGLAACGNNLRQVGD